MHARRARYGQKRFLSRIVFFTVFLFIVGCWGALYGVLDFPFDHGPHFDVLNEWWYFTGETLTTEGKTLGFEFTIFKRWVESRNDFAYLGHLAVSDPETAEHLFAEVATSTPVSGIEEGKADIAIDDFSYSFRKYEGFRIQAEAGELSVDLSLTPTRTALPHGEDGIIVMGDGIDSHYYSFTNLLTAGNISVRGVEHLVSSGRTWMDHQWGDYTLFGLYWDWFSMRFEDGGALMLFQFRDIFDQVVRSTWTYRPATGPVQYGEGFSLQAARTYEDENGDCTYPIDWIVDLQDIDAQLVVSPLFDEQSLYEVMTPLYWEGLCSVEGTLRGESVTGSAYVELTGYENE
jgi:predicted secreted hydrolase